MNGDKQTIPLTYDELAQVNRRAITEISWPKDRTVAESVVVAQANEFQKVDPEFNRTLFLLACGVSKP